VSQFTTIMNAPADAVHGRVFYLGDGAIDSALWLDEFSFQLTGLRTRRAPAWVLKLLARGGDALERFGYAAPLDSERLMRMSTDYHVPLEPTLSLTGPPPWPRVSLAPSPGCERNIQICTAAKTSRQLTPPKLDAPGRDAGELRSISPKRDSAV
jgi:hypothetical protein